MRPNPAPTTLMRPVYTGIGANRYVELSEGGRGKKGGLSEFARRCGKDKGNLARYRDAAEVYEFARNRCNVTTVSDLLDKASHLAAIHKAPEETWAVLVGALVKREWTVKDTEHWAGKASAFIVSSLTTV